MNRILNKVNSHETPRPPTLGEHLACWKIGKGSYSAFGPSIKRFVRLKRGQLQLRNIANVFKEAAQFESKLNLTEKDARVKMLLKNLNSAKDKLRGQKWFFVAGSIIERDPGKTGAIVVERTLVIVARRKIGC
jgi:hypothetical protein